MGDKMTLPGDIPRLLRRGSPVRPAAAGAWHDMRGYPCSLEARSVVRGAPHPGYDSVYLCDWGNTPLSGVALDLNDPTGRAHAAWFVLHPTWDEPIHTLPSWVSRRQFAELMAHAIEGRGMEPHRIDLLRRVVLHVAGREIA